LPLAEAYGDLITRSEIHRHIGFYHLVDDKNYDEALRYLRISLDLRRRHGDLPLRARRSLTYVVRTLMRDFRWRR
jgi:hypothetical protein